MQVGINSQQNFGMIHVINLELLKKLEQFKGYKFRNLADILNDTSVSPQIKESIKTALNRVCESGNSNATYVRFLETDDWSGIMDRETDKSGRDSFLNILMENSKNFTAIDVYRLLLVYKIKQINLKLLQILGNKKSIGYKNKMQLLNDEMSLIKNTISPLSKESGSRLSANTL